MDEIEQIKGLRAGLPSAPAKARAAARLALLERMEGAGRRSSPRRFPPDLRNPRLIAAGAGLLALAAAIPVLLLGGGEGGVQTAAARALQRAAAVAASQPSKAPRPGHLLFTRTSEAHLVISFREGGEVAARTRRRFQRIRRSGRGGLKQHPWWVLVPELREIWLRQDGSARLREVSGRARFLSSRQRAAWLAAGSPPLPRAGKVSVRRLAKHSLGGLYFSRLPDLPIEPHALRRWLEANAYRIPGSLATAGTTSTGLRSVGGSHARLFADVGFLLGESFARPALRASLFRVAAEIPGVRLLGTVADQLGRRGIGVAYTDPRHGQRLELIFDPRTSTLLGERYIVTSAKRSGIPVAPGTVVAYSTRLATTVSGP